MTDFKSTAQKKSERKCRNNDLLQQFYNDLSTQPPQHEQTTEKNNQTSNKLRIEGHEHFLNHHYVNAIDKYNESLCHAEITGDKFNLSMAFGHRAEAYFKMRLFHECLTSIQLALASSYPEELQRRMTVLQRLCREEIEREGEDGGSKLEYTVKLAHPARDHLPTVFADLQLRKSGRSGRHLVTERDLCVGDVLAIEDAYLSELRPTDRYKRCANCLSEQRHALFPCSFCTNVMFCSQGCEKDSWKVFHRYECGISDYLLTLEATARVAIKALLLGLSLFRDLAVMKQFLERSESEDFSAIDPDFRYEDAEDQFLAFYKLNGNDEHLDSRRRTRLMKRCAEVLSVLKRQNDLSEKLGRVEEVFLLEFLYHVVCITLNNGVEFGGSPERTIRITRCC